MGIFGIIHALANIWATIELVKSNKPTGPKVLWALAVWLIPIFGLLVYIFIGRKSS